MPHVTSIGLDVHARSVAAAAFNPFTGEVVRRDFGTDAAEIAEWVCFATLIFGFSRLIIFGFHVFRQGRTANPPNSQTCPS